MKSVFIKRILAGFFVLALTSCDDLDGMNAVKMPHVFGDNEVPPEVLAVPRLVKVPPPLAPETPFPLVGTVPMKPDNFTSRPLIQETFQQMEDDRANALAKKQEVEGTEPVALPGTATPSSAQPTIVETPAPPSEESSTPAEILSTSPVPENTPSLIPVPVSTPVPVPTPLPTP